ncbi:MAG: hypothetical protein Q8880_11620 [Bacteroidota bacterium]|nr:hypothetical protein [Bacteroidota bacterium]
MKNIFIRIPVVLIFVFISTLNYSCYKEKETIGNITVYDASTNKTVAGATVKLYHINSDINMVFTTDGNGKVSHIFDNEAILDILATSNNKSGSASIRLRRGETVDQSVYIQ